MRRTEQGMRGQERKEETGEVEGTGRGRQAEESLGKSSWKMKKLNDGAGSLWMLLKSPTARFLR